VLKHVSRHVAKVNAVNYQARAPPVEEYIYEENANLVNDETWDF